MRKNTIVTAIFFVLIVITAILFVVLSKEKSSAFWISLITTELSLCLLGGAAVLYTTPKQFNRKMKSATLGCAVYYLIASAIINLLFGRFFSINTGIYIAIHILLIVLLCFVFVTSILFKKKKRHRNKPKEERSAGIPALLTEIQNLEALVSKLNPDIQIDIESMLLSLDKEVRYVKSPEGTEGEHFQSYIKEKIISLTPLLNNLIESQDIDTRPIAKMIIDLKYLLDNPDLVPKKALAAPEPEQLEEVSEVNPSVEETETFNQREIEIEIPISMPLKEIDLSVEKALVSEKTMDLNLPEAPDYEEITDLSDSDLAEPSNSPEKSEEENTENSSKVDQSESKNSQDDFENPSPKVSEESLAEENLTDTFKEKISEIEDLAKNISSFEELERSFLEEKSEEENKN